MIPRFRWMIGPVWFGITRTDHPIATLGIEIYWLNTNGIDYQRTAHHRWYDEQQAWWRRWIGESVR